MGVKIPPGVNILKLYLRLPERIIDEQQILDLHPNIIEVILPRQRSRRWCLIHFSTGTDANKSFKELKSIKVNNKSVFVKFDKGDGKQYKGLPRHCPGQEEQK